jgi:hypothetical protein
VELTVASDVPAPTRRWSRIQLTHRHERLLVTLVALHSFSVGAMLFLVPQWTMGFAGWEHIDPVFFGRQAGIFHIVLAVAYVLEYQRYRGVSILITAKLIAVVFLAGATIVDPLPWAVWTSGLLDGLMAAVVWLVHRRVEAR